VVAAAKESTNVAERMVKKAVNIGDAVNVGNNIYTTNTDPFRLMLSWKTTQRYGYGSYSRTVKQVILCIDSTLISIRKQGDWFHYITY
jgi:hypothetical protein